jgi:Protein of unknown function DUF47
MAGHRATERLGRLIGRRPAYGELYELFGRAGRNVQLSTGVLRELMRSWPDGAEKRHHLVDLEHENDAVTHDILDHLHARLAVPLERSDVLALASGLDDIVAYAEEAADFLGLYSVEARWIRRSRSPTPWRPRAPRLRRRFPAWTTSPPRPAT